jgi:hypothetical protein
MIYCMSEWLKNEIRGFNTKNHLKMWKYIGVWLKVETKVVTENIWRTKSWCIGRVQNVSTHLWCIWDVSNGV